MATTRRKKAINFDLDTQRLRELFGENGRKNAYADIRRFLQKNGFEHRQGSGYRSLAPLSDLEIADLIVALYKTLTWLPECVQKLDVTNIGREYDLDAIAKRRIKTEVGIEQAILFDVEL